VPLPEPACAVCGTLLPCPGDGCPSCATSTVETPAVPELPGFRILALLGRGGMGAVYLADDLALGRKVAIKVLAEKFQGEMEARDRFLREARALAGIDHPNVVRIHSLGTNDGKTFIVMEYVDGESLAHRIAKGPMDPNDALRVARQAAAGLAAAWAKGIVHRDVKPSNILLASSDHVRVADFGLAKPIEVDASFVTVTGIVLGTPHYIAPEQARGEAVDLRTDIYSLGVTLYEMATGTRPFGGKTPVEILAHHLHTPMPPLPSAQLVPGLGRAIARMTEKSPAQRPGSYAELSALLEEAGASPSTGAGTEPVLAAHVTPPHGSAIAETAATQGVNSARSDAEVPRAAPETRTALTLSPTSAMVKRARARPVAMAVLGVSLLAATVALTSGWASLLKRFVVATPVRTVTYEATEVDTPPVALQAAAPAFVPSNQEGCLGTVSIVMTFVVTETGEVTEIALDPGADPAVAGSAVLYLSKRKYSPALKGGEPVRVRSKWRYTSPSEFRTLSALQSQAQLIEEGKMPVDQAIGCIGALDRILSAGLPASQVLAPVGGSGRAEALRALVAIPHSYPALEDSDLDSIGWSLVNAGYEEAAIRTFEIALARLPETGEGYERLADGFAKAGAKGKALRAYRLAASLNPNRESTRLKLAALNAPKVSSSTSAQPGETYQGARVYDEADVEKSPLLFSHNTPKPTLDPGRVVSVTVSWIVTPEGSVDDPKVVASGGADIDAFVVDGIKKWRYEPGQKDGKVVPVRVLRKYTFGQRR
jgi:serine/threonine protein kinase